MEVAEFAQQILFGQSLEAKLTTPLSLTDTKPGSPIAVPEAPGRHGSVRFPHRGERVRAALPTIHDLEHEEKRGMLLHFFANHELLALEIMALALLRFPAAPAKFRRGLVGTMFEEQKHLQLYLSRMQEFGVELGSIPVNRYFWDVMADTPNPLTFVTQMSLTVEQANLDFSHYYMEIFQKLEDHATAALLQSVYEDEIGHVRLGLQWFQKWKPDELAELSEWEVYKALLPLPMTPARAKGLCYDAPGRRRAGLSEAFIQELRIYQHSKGRPPRVLYFNPEFEEEMALGLKDFVPNKALKTIRSDLSPLMLFMAGQDDVVLVPTRPTSAFLTQLHAAGFSGCQIVEHTRDLKGRLLQTFEPWGRSPSASRLATTIQADWMEPIAPPIEQLTASKLWSKDVAKRLAPVQTPGEIVHSVEDALALLTSKYALAPAVIKAPFGTAGRQALRVFPGESLSPQKLGWLEKTIANQTAVVIEPWLEKVADFSMQIIAGETGKETLGLTRFLTSGRGQYVGHVLGRKLDGLSPDVVRAYHEQDVPGRLMGIAQQVAQELTRTGYKGPAGIDALMYRDAKGVHLYPIVEINVRYTMGRIALALDRRVHASVRARWCHFSAAEIERLGYASFMDFSGQIADKVPLTHKNDCLTSGIVFTNDPATAQGMLTVLLVGDEALALAPQSF